MFSSHCFPPQEISTHALTEGDWSIRQRNHPPHISTHALTEGDRGFWKNRICFDYFNSRPHGGRRVFFTERFSRCEFQLTPSRRATSFFLPFHLLLCISTHALTEGDLYISGPSFPSIFQLTPSRRATYRSQSIAERRDISTHALTEGDINDLIKFFQIRDFNSRPHGGRRTASRNWGLAHNISTHALTEGDCSPFRLADHNTISTHALTEGD